MGSAQSSVRRYHVISEMTRQGEMTLADPLSPAVFQVVTYQDDTLYDQLATVNIGSIVTVGLEQAGSRANVYIAYRPPDGLSITHNPPLQLETRVSTTDDADTTEIKHSVLVPGSDDTTPPTV